MPKREKERELARRRKRKKERKKLRAKGLLSSAESPRGSVKEEDKKKPEKGFQEASPESPKEGSSAPKEQT